MNSASEVELLLVEDNPYDAELAIHALKKRNLANQLVWVKDGEEALKFLFGEREPSAVDLCHRPKVILLDLKLPKVDGLEVLRQIKSSPVGRHIPVVVMTSSMEEPDIARCYALGCNSYIVKPLDFLKFADAVTQLGLYWLVINQPSVPLPATPPPS